MNSQATAKPLLSYSKRSGDAADTKLYAIELQMRLLVSIHTHTHTHIYV